MFEVHTQADSCTHTQELNATFGNTQRDGESEREMQNVKKDKIKGAAFPNILNCICASFKSTG